MQDALRQQFGATLDDLESALRAIPESHWEAGENWKHQPWYLAYHSLFWLDLYLGESSDDYRPPAPFTLSEMQENRPPERVYTRDELLGWLAGCRAALAARLETLATPDDLRRVCRLHWGEMQAGELMLYNLRHVQHHVGQLNLRLRGAGACASP